MYSYYYMPQPHNLFLGYKNNTAITYSGFWQFWKNIKSIMIRLQIYQLQLKMDVPILTYIFCTFNCLTLTSEMHFSKFHPQVASCLLSRGKRKYAPLGMRLLSKYIRNYFLVYHLNFTLFVVSPKLQRI